MRAVCILALCLAAFAADTTQYAYNPLSDTGCTSGPTTGLRRMVQWLEANYEGQPWWHSDDGYVANRRDSLHCAGRAVDWVMNGCTSAGLAEGNAIVSYLVANGGARAKAWGVQTIIFRGKIWTPRQSYAERAYTTQGVGYTCSQGGTAAKTQSHWDHVHLDLNIWGSINFPAQAGGGGSGPAPTPGPARNCPTGFCVGEQCQFNTIVNLRQSASTSGVKARATTNGEICTILNANPTSNGGYQFWNIRCNGQNSVWAARGDNWFNLYRGTGNLETPPPQTGIFPNVGTNVTLYSDICIEGTTRQSNQVYFEITSEVVNSCNKDWFEVKVDGETTPWYLAYDNTTMMMDLIGAPEAGEPNDVDMGLIGSGFRALPVWSVVVAIAAALFAVRV